MANAVPPWRREPQERLSDIQLECLNRLLRESLGQPAQHQQATSATSTGPSVQSGAADAGLGQSAHPLPATLYSSIQPCGPSPAPSTASLAGQHETAAKKDQAADEAKHEGTAGGLDPENPQPEAASMEVEAPTEGAAREAADEAKPETTITSQPEPNAAVDQNRKRYGRWSPDITNPKEVELRRIKDLKNQREIKRKTLKGLYSKSKKNQPDA